MPSSLLARTQELLAQRPYRVTLRVIQQETGVDMSFIDRLSRDKIKDPGVIKVQKLYEYLSGCKLKF